MWPRMRSIALPLNLNFGGRSVKSGQDGEKEIVKVKLIEADQRKTKQLQDEPRKNHGHTWTIKLAQQAVPWEKLIECEAFKVLTRRDAIFKIFKYKIQ